MSEMKKTEKNKYDNKFFQSKKDMEYYIHLEELQKNKLIQSFSLESFVDEKTELIKYRSKSVEIDEKEFASKTDADYYIYLTGLKKENVIREFSLDLIQRNKTEKAKYMAKKVEINGHLFDSKAEADYYLHLLEQKRLGVIADFRLQPPFELQPAFKKNGKSFRKIEYIADFEVIHLNNESEVIDVKGMMTSDFMLKMKIFEYKYPDKTLTLVKYVEKYGGWITVDEWKKFKRATKTKKKS